MAAVTIELPDEQLQRLETEASRRGVDVNQLVRQTIDAFLDDEEEAFRNAAEYVLRKNAELYRRLAQ